MTGIEKYTQPGILEEYCLGLLSDAEAREITAAAKQCPQLQQQIEAAEQLLMGITAVTAKPALKESILSVFDNLAETNKISLANPPFIHRNSDLNEWKEALENLQPDKDYGNIKVHYLKDTPDHQLCVAWLHDVLDEAEHHANEFAESFFIVEGSCECNIGGQIVCLKAGDYLDIPYNTHHTIKATSPEIGYVKAIIQRRKLAA